MNKLTLSTTARSAIVASYVDALSANESTGSLVTQVCDVARKYTKGADIAEEDRSAIVADISKARGWKGKSAKSRCSEVNVVLRAHASLPEAIEAYRAKAKSVQWHDSMKLARRINAGDSITQAVKAAFVSGGSGAKVSPSGRTAGALKAWYKAEPRKREAILKAAELLNIKLGIKLDA
jgi:hypothetical protein